MAGSIKRMTNTIKYGQSQKMKMSSQKLKKWDAIIVRPTTLQGDRKLVLGDSHQPKQRAMMLPSGLNQSILRGPNYVQLSASGCACNARVAHALKATTSLILRMSSSMAHANESKAKNNLLYAKNIA